MKKGWKYKISRMTGNNYKVDKKVLQLKRSWDEVDKILGASVKKKKK